jgi:rhodanese-related sulfurtransferase/DNA-binding MarR family transcriptional regulator
MEKRAFKNNIYAAIASMTKAFSNPNRLEILDLLANGEKSVEQVATQTAITVANASQHLQILKNAGLVSTRRAGNFIYYAPAGPQVYAAWKALQDLAILQQPSVGVTLHSFRSEMGTAESASIQSLPANDEVLLLDVRPADEFAAGHIENARSIPIGELPLRLHELPKGKTIIAYCRGPFCTMADEAVQLLKSNGFAAVRLEESYLDAMLLQEKPRHN